jgi:hypothetical protein
MAKKVSFSREITKEGKSEKVEDIKRVLFFLHRYEQKSLLLQFSFFLLLFLCDFDFSIDLKAKKVSFSRETIKEGKVEDIKISRGEENISFRHFSLKDICLPLLVR